VHSARALYQLYAHLSANVFGSDSQAQVMVMMMMMMMMMITTMITTMIITIITMTLSLLQQAGFIASHSGAALSCPPAFGVPGQVYCP
jgi:hypothetical protein